MLGLMRRPPTYINGAAQSAPCFFGRLRNIVAWVVAAIELSHGLAVAADLAAAFLAGLACFFGRKAMGAPSCMSNAAAETRDLAAPALIHGGKTPGWNAGFVVIGHTGTRYANERNPEF